MLTFKQFLFKYVIIDLYEIYQSLPMAIPFFLIFVILKL